MSSRGRGQRARTTPVSREVRREELCWPPAARDQAEVLELGGARPEAWAVMASGEEAPGTDGPAERGVLEWDRGDGAQGDPVAGAEAGGDVAPATPDVSPGARRPARWPSRDRVAVMGLSAVVVAQAAFIFAGRLPSASVAPASATARALAAVPGAAGTSGRGEAGGRPPAAGAGEARPAAGVEGAPLVVGSKPPGAKVTADGSRAAAPVRATSARPPARANGSLVVSAPIDLQIFEDGRLVGISSARVSVTAGQHRLLLKNAETGFEQQHLVDVAPGKSASLAVALPRQRVSVNASPWAEVWVDGARAGETPLGTLQLPIGPHVILFRHPQFGDKTTRLLVRADQPGRVSVDMRQ